MPATNTENDSGLRLETASAMALCRDVATFTAQDVQATLRSAVDPAATVVVTGDAGGAFMLTVHGRLHVAFAVPHPVPAEDFAVTLATSGDNPDLAAIVREHRAHVVVSALGEAQTLHDACEHAALVMQVAASLRGGTGPMGVFWLPSRSLAPAEIAEVIGQTAVAGLADIRSGASSVTQSMPVPFWVAVRLYGGDGLVSGTTQGLACFTGHELHLPPSRRSPQDVHGLLTRMVAYLLDSGAVLRDGERVGAGSGPQDVLTLSLRPGPEGGAPVMMMMGGGEVG